MRTETDMFEYSIYSLLESGCSVKTFITLCRRELKLTTVCSSDVFRCHRVDEW